MAFASKIIINNKIRSILKTLYHGLISILGRWRQSRYLLTEIQQAKKIIIFLLPERTSYSGGVLSIFNLCATTRKIMPDATVVLATFPSFFTYAQLTWFDNNEKIYRLSQIINKTLSAQEVYIHIPEYISGKFVTTLSDEVKHILKRIPDLHINILNQNILLMPPPAQVQDLFSLTAHVTQTTAHNRYSNQTICDRWKMPLHHFSSILPTPLEQQILPLFEEKAASLRIVFSPDEHPAKKILQDAIQQALPDCTITTIRRMSYTEYFSHISQALFVVTFGEGFDAYFMQPHLVGTVSFAIFNEDFFPNAHWKTLENVFESYNDAAEHIGQKMQELLQDKQKYTEIVRKNKAMLDELYSQKKLDTYIQEFYQHKYHFTPMQMSERQLA